MKLGYQNLHRKHCKYPMMEKIEPVEDHNADGQSQQLNRFITSKYSTVYSRYY